jgi:hypothetical protein
MPKHVGVEIWNVLIKIHNFLEHLLVFFTNGTTRWSVQPSIKLTAIYNVDNYCIPDCVCVSNLNWRFKTSDCPSEGSRGCQTERTVQLLQSPFAVIGLQIKMAANVLLDNKLRVIVVLLRKSDIRFVACPLRYHA